MPPLTVARVGLGVAAFLKALEFWPLLDRLAADPRIVPMPLLPWPRPSIGVAHGLVAVWASLGLTIAAGQAVPIGGPLLAAVLGFVVTLDQQTYANHLYLLALLSLLLGLAHTPRHRADALGLLRWQLVVVYAFAAASKINADFLSGAVLAENLRPSLAARLPGSLLATIAVTAVAAEAFVAWSLMRPAWRTAGAIVGIGLHAAFILTITQTVAMIAFALICLSLYPLYWLDEPSPAFDAPGTP